MTAGYNIQCDAGGGLYYQTCYVIDSSGQKNEILGYTDNGGIITKTKSNIKGTAWTPQLFTLNDAGNQYQPYRGGNIPYGYLGNFTPRTSADSQDLYYLNEVMPTSQAWRKQQSYVGKWWMNIFGLKQEQRPSNLQSESAEAIDNPNIEDSENKKQEPNIKLGLGFTAIGLLGGYLIAKSMTLDTIR